MRKLHFQSVRVVVAVMTLPFVSIAVPASGQDAAAQQAIGRVDFDFSGAPPANVEVDLKNGMLSALSGIAKAAVEGVAEGLTESSNAPAVQQSADHLQAVNEVLDVVTEAIHELRVRVYENLEERDIQASMLEHYRKKLDGSRWQNVVRVRDEHESVAICVQQEQSTIHGVFVMVSDGNDLVLANVVCELTPERVKQLTNQATRIGMKFGLEGLVEEAMREISHAHVHQRHGAAGSAEALTTRARQDEPR